MESGSPLQTRRAGTQFTVFRFLCWQPAHLPRRFAASDLVPSRVMGFIASFYPHALLYRVAFRSQLPWLNSCYRSLLFRHKLFPLSSF